MTTFKKLNTAVLQKSGPKITPDFIYWKQLQPPVLVKEFGPIDYIDFSPQDPHYFAVTCSVKVQVYNPITKLVVKNFSRFRESAYGAVFRNDGNLLLAGSEEKNLKLFDVSTKSMLRFFKGHTAPVHRVAFINNEPKIASFSDDKSVRVWDLPTENILNTFEGHNDYIRAGIINPDVPNIILSGGYDNIIKMWDTRTDKEVMTMNHGSPVESLLFMPHGGMFLSAGGTEIKIWDALAGGKLRGSLVQHHKTVTCLKLASNGKRLLSGSLDRHVKIFDTSTFKVVHTLNFSNSVLSLGISKDDSTLAAGLVDGVIAIQRRSDEVQPEKVTKKSNSHRFLTTNIPTTVNEVVSETKFEKEAKYDHNLRKFEFSKALQFVLLPANANKYPEKVVLVLRELSKRQALSKALKDKNIKTITQLIRFFYRNISDLRFTKILIEIANEFLDIIADTVGNLPPDIAVALVQLYKTIKQEEELTEELCIINGMLETLTSSQISSVS